MNFDYNKRLQDAVKAGEPLTLSGFGRKLMKERAMKLPQYHASLEADRVVSSGTLRTQDLLRAFANEYLRMMPFNGQRLYNEAYSYAAQLDEGDHVVDDDGTLIDPTEVVQELSEELSHIAAAHGLTFGTQEGDGACFGFWSANDD